MQQLWPYASPLIFGFIVGLLFRLFNFPIPAPSTIAGILGILGIYLGYMVLK